MNDREIKKRIIENYIEAYNNFDVENMLKDLDKKIVFQNISSGTINLETTGIEDFRAQAELVKNFFSQREQKIANLEFAGDEAEAEIFYRGVVAVDLPNSLKSGDVIELQGKSIFRFEGDKIISIEDIS